VAWSFKGSCPGERRRLGSPKSVITSTLTSSRGSHRKAEGDGVRINLERVAGEAMLTRVGVEQWQDKAYNHVYRKIFQDKWRGYDPWNLTGHLDANMNM
jgi:hypothetical protein